MNDMMFLFEPATFISIVAILAIGWWVFAIVRRMVRRARASAEADAIRSRLLNEIPSELRFRVYERDQYICQSCGTQSDLIVDFTADVPDDPPVRLQDLITRCARCAAIERQSGMMRETPNA